MKNNAYRSICLLARQFRLNLIAIATCTLVLSFAPAVCCGQGLGGGMMGDEPEPEPPPKNVTLVYQTAELQAMTAEQLSEKMNAAADEMRPLLKDLISAKLRFEHATKDESYEYGKQWRQAVTESQVAFKKIKEISMVLFLKENQPSEDLLDTAGRMAYEAAREGRIGIAAKVMKKCVRLRPDFKPFQTENARLAMLTNDLGTAAKFMADNPKAIEEFSEIERALFLGLDVIQEMWEAEQEIRKRESEADDLPRVEIETTKGKIVIELFENEVPHTVHNFVSLVESGFYEKRAFHVVFRDFKAVGGLYSFEGLPPTDYTIVDEARVPGARMSFRGSVAMRNPALTEGASEFSIYSALSPFSSADVGDTVIGRVIEGMEAVELLKVNARFKKGSLDVERVNARADSMKDDIILKTRVVRKRPGVEYLPKKVTQAVAEKSVAEKATAEKTGKEIGE